MKKSKNGDVQYVGHGYRISRIIMRDADPGEGRSGF